MTPLAPTGRARVTLAVTGVLTLSMALGLTAAAYTDHATVNLGTGVAGSGIGNPDRFDIAVRDAAAVLHDAQTPEDALVLALTDGQHLSEISPVVFTVPVVNRDPGLPGDLTLSLYDPDPVPGDAFDSLCFTISVDGTEAIAGATAQQVNDAGLRFDDVQPGQEHIVEISALLVADSGLDVAGKSTQIGLQADGESR